MLNSCLCESPTKEIFKLLEEQHYTLLKNYFEFLYMYVCVSMCTCMLI